ncbi:type I glyceraldehyde-3-phosphate dehydrogenase [Actinomycetospora sp. CA-101289]|uniref:type I glyceraldehyde-3-phosphate dehydrogenase n=1 Tax=Actinomycetospora sp. CA-101289 TaxID=3239893 RepID=UPI003D97B320
MSVRVGINGFGRIGRTVFRAAQERRTSDGDTDIEIVAVNDVTDAATLAHLLRRDSVRGRYPGEVEAGDGQLLVDGRPVTVTAGRVPGELPWADLGVDIVVEATGRFTAAADARGHLDAGARRVLVTAPAADADLTLVVGVNDDADDGTQEVVSGASCTTNCVAPMAKVLHDAFGLVTGFMTTVHAYTGDQRLHDAPHKDPRRARAAAVNIIPTTTGAARAATLALPELAGRLDGIAIRVPVVDGSVTDLTATLASDVTVAAVNEAFRAAAGGPLGRVLEYTEDPIVSTDVVGSPASCTFDAAMTKTMGPRTVKILGWYDNEWGYSQRVVDLAGLLSRPCPKNPATARTRAPACTAPPEGRPS